MNYVEKLNQLKVQLEKEEASKNAMIKYLSEKKERQHRGQVRLAEAILTMGVSQLREYIIRDKSLFSDKGILAQLDTVAKSNDNYEKELGTEASNRYWNEVHAFMFEDLDDEFTESEMSMTL